MSTLNVEVTHGNWTHDLQPTWYLLNHWAKEVLTDSVSRLTWRCRRTSTPSSNSWSDLPQQSFAKRLWVLPSFGVGFLGGCVGSGLSVTFLPQYLWNTERKHPSFGRGDTRVWGCDSRFHLGCAMRKVPKLLPRVRVKHKHKHRFIDFVQSTPIPIQRYPSNGFCAHSIWQIATPTTLSPK